MTNFKTNTLINLTISARAHTSRNNNNTKWRTSQRVGVSLSCASAVAACDGGAVADQSRQVEARSEERADGN